MTGLVYRHFNERFGMQALQLNVWYIGTSMKGLVYKHFNEKWLG